MLLFELLLPKVFLLCCLSFFFSTQFLHFLSVSLLPCDELFLFLYSPFLLELLYVALCGVLVRSRLCPSLHFCLPSLLPFFFHFGPFLLFFLGALLLVFLLHLLNVPMYSAPLGLLVLLELLLSYHFPYLFLVSSEAFGLGLVDKLLEESIIRLLHDQELLQIQFLLPSGQLLTCDTAACFLLLGLGSQRGGIFGGSRRLRHLLSPRIRMILPCQVTIAGFDLFE